MRRLGNHNTSSASLDRLTDGQVPLSQRFTESDRARFWAKVDRRGPDDCWPWTASLYTPSGTAGYGQFAVAHPNGTPRKQLHLLAHRVAWIVAHGDIPDGLFVLHRCDRPGCCNPKHLFLGDHVANMQDAASKGRLHVTRPKNHKIPTEQLADIDALLDTGATQARIAAQYGVSKTWVCLYAKGIRRKYDSPARREAVA